MENKPKESMESPSMMTYVIGAVLVLAVVGGAWYFRAKSPDVTTEPTSETSMEAEITPAAGPITELACDNQYFNPKIGFNEYYLSVEGGDVNEAASVECAFSVTVDDEEVATATANSPLTAAPQRGGQTFRCTTDAVELTPGVISVVNVRLTDDLGESVDCFAEFNFPAP